MVWLLSDHLPGEIDVYPMSSIELFERAFVSTGPASPIALNILHDTQCTNFSCCNILFPDLHALLDHYDATTAAHSHDCFPAPLSFSYSPASSPPSSPSTHNSTPTASPPHRRSVSLACPNADAPPSPILLNSHLNMSLSLSLNPTLAQYPIVPGLVPMVHPSIYHPDASALADYPTYEHCYDTATRYLASARGSDAESSAPLNSQSPGPGPGIGIGSIGKGEGGAGKTRRRRSSLSSSPGSLSQSSSSSDASVPSPTKKKKKGKADPAGASLSGTRRRRRSQKAYQCPVCFPIFFSPSSSRIHRNSLIFFFSSIAHFFPSHLYFIFQLSVYLIFFFAS